MSNTGDKFQVVTDPFMPPQKCAACNTQKISEYIDFGLTIKRYGRVYLCKECFIEAYQSLNVVIPVSSHLEEIEKLKEENANLTYLLNIDLHGLQSYLSNVLTEPEDDKQLEQSVTQQIKRGPGRPKRTE